MNSATTLQNTPVTGPIGLWNRIATQLEGWIGHNLIALASRAAVAAIFFYSARTKVDGLLTIKDTTFLLFEEEYKVPLLPPEFAAYMATYAEHLFPVLLVLGLLTRLSAAALLGMTAVIQIFVYPDAWPTHLTWAVPMICMNGRRHRACNKMAFSKPLTSTLSPQAGRGRALILIPSLSSSPATAPDSSTGSFPSPRLTAVHCAAAIPPARGASQ
jgi:putative oxidoreductase